MEKQREVEVEVKDSVKETNDREKSDKNSNEKKGGWMAPEKETVWN